MCRATYEGGRRCDGTHKPKKYVPVELYVARRKAEQLVLAGKLEENPLTDVSRMKDTPHIKEFFDTHFPKHENPFYAVKRNRVRDDDLRTLPVADREAARQKRAQQRTQAQTLTQHTPETSLPVLPELNEFPDYTISNRLQNRQVASVRSNDRMKRIVTANEHHTDPDTHHTNPKERFRVSHTTDNLNSIGVLGLDEIDAVRMGVAHNPKTPLIILEHLAAKDRNKEVAEIARLRVEHLKK